MKESEFSFTLKTAEFIAVHKRSLFVLGIIAALGLIFRFQMEYKGQLQERSREKIEFMHLFADALRNKVQAVMAGGNFDELEGLYRSIKEEGWMRHIEVELYDGLGRPSLSDLRTVERIAEKARENPDLFREIMPPETLEKKIEEMRSRNRPLKTASSLPDTYRRHFDEALKEGASEMMVKTDGLRVFERIDRNKPECVVCHEGEDAVIVTTIHIDAMMAELRKNLLLEKIGQFLVFVFALGALWFVGRCNDKYKILQERINTEQEREKAVELESYARELEKAHQELKTKQEDLIRAARSAGLGTLAAGIAHDFNNILTGILGNTELALDETDQDGIKELLELTRKQVLRAGDLTERLLFIGRNIKSKIEETDLGEAVEDGLKILERQFETKGIRLERKFFSPIPSILADGGQLRDVVTNLTSNSLHAMESYLEKQRAEGKNPEMKLTISCEASEGKVELTFTDTGGGIPDEIMPHIFDPFFTTKDTPGLRGTGLGLAMVEAIVKNHGGNIRIESVTPEMIAKRPELKNKTPGTMVRIVLPMKNGEKRTEEKKPEEEPKTMDENFFHDSLIYLVDDEESVRTVGERMLAGSGYKKVKIFSNGREALEAFRAALAKGEELPHLILTDIQMPELDGLSFCRELSRIEKPHKPRIVILTGLATNGNLSPFYELGIFESLGKPFQKRDLISAASKALVSHPLSGRA